MRFSKLKTKIQKLLVFDKEILRSFEPREDTLDENIKYWLKKGWIVSLKKGQYLLKERFQKEPDKDRFLEYIANYILRPSYVSAEYILAKYQILPEPVRSLTSVTTKSSRETNNDLGAFRYYSVRGELFRGYKVVYFYEAPVLIAELSKALFDFLYLRFWRETMPGEEIVKSLRLNWENISKKDFEKAKFYLKFTSNQRLVKTFKIIERLYYAR